MHNQDTANKGSGSSGKKTQFSGRCLYVNGIKYLVDIDSLNIKTHCHRCKQDVRAGEEYFSNFVCIGEVHYVAHFHAICHKKNEDDGHYRLSKEI